jgi:hypothetical protein
VVLIRIQSSLVRKKWNAPSPRRAALSRVKAFLLCFPVPPLPSGPERNPAVLHRLPTTAAVTIRYVQTGHGLTKSWPIGWQRWATAASFTFGPLPARSPPSPPPSLPSLRWGDRRLNVYALPTAPRMLASAADRVLIDRRRPVLLPSCMPQCPPSWCHRRPLACIQDRPRTRARARGRRGTSALEHPADWTPSGGQAAGTSR